MIHSLSLASLQKLDCGNISDAFDAALKRAVADCVNRPREDRARKINLQVELTPDQEGDDVDVTVQVKETIPSHQSTPLRMSVRKQGSQLMLVFQTEEEAA